MEKLDKSSEHVSGECDTEDIDVSVSGMSGRNSLCSSVDITPCETPSKQNTPRLSRKEQILQLSEDDSTWKVVKQKQKRKLRKHKINLSTSKTKLQAIIMNGDIPEMRFKTIVALLLAIIIIIIITTRYLYSSQRFFIAIRDQIYFLKKHRQLDLLDSNGRDLLHINLGENIPKDIKPINCFSPATNNQICLEYKYRSHLDINFERKSQTITCYHVKWKSYHKHSTLKDCFDIRDAYWYGMGDVYDDSWPLNHMSFGLSPFVTSHRITNESRFGSIIGRYWFSSKGIAITVPLDIPLFVSFNSSENPNKLCFESRNAFPYNSNLHSLSNTGRLEYTVCTSPHLPNLHNYTMQQTLNISNTNNSNSDVISFMNQIIWSPDFNVLHNFTQHSLQSYVDRITSDGFEPGFILLDSRWETYVGEYKFNETSFNNQFLDILHNKGFKILLTITPNINLYSNVLSIANSQNRLFEDSKLNVPLLTRCGNNHEYICGIINLTDVSNREWFSTRLNEQLLTAMKIDGFLFKGGVSSLMPRNIYSDSHQNPDYYLNYYKQIAVNTSSLIGIMSSVSSDAFNGFVTILPRKSTWQQLQTIIPTVLSLSLIGYPIVNVGTVGGEREAQQTEFDKELYIRWLELCAFLPVIQFGEPPGDNDLDIIKVAKMLLKTRQDRVLPVMKQSLNEYYNSGAPIIRPMWWTEQQDIDAYRINDQFSIGNDIIVAPILESGKIERDIYLPHGEWKDDIQARVIKGGKWMRKYRVPIDKVPYFIRMQ